MLPADTVNFVASLVEALESNDTKVALSIARCDSNSIKIQENPWDIVPVITSYINETIERENKELFTCCQDLLDIVVSKAYADDILLLLISDIESAKDDVMFLELINPLQQVLLRVPKKRLKYLSWSLNAIQAYLKQLPIPEEYDFEDSERAIIDADEEVERISYVFYETVPFYQPVIVSYKQTGMIEPLKILTKYLIYLLGKPLVLLDMGICEDGTKTRARRVGEDIILKLLQTCKDPYILFKGCDAEDLASENEFALGAVFYLLLSQHVGIEKIPRVYDHFYVFQTSLYLVITLLSQMNQFVIDKGLCLAQTITQNLGDMELSHMLLQCYDHSQFCRAISLIIIYNVKESYRKRALSIFNTYVFRFNDCGRYTIISNLVRVLDFAGYFKSYLITQYKQMMVDEFAKALPMSPYFCGKKLLRLLLIFCHLEKGEETDLIDSSDQIVASLNLLRYLIIRDKDNVTSIRNHIKVLEKTYLSRLRKALLLSRAHYKRKVQDIADGHTEVHNEGIRVSVAGDLLPDMTTTEKLTVLNSSLTAFDVIDSLLSRVIELAEG